MAGHLSAPVSAPGLAAYLRAGAAEPFGRGGCDCCLWACGWVVLRRGVDPAGPLRGRYRTAIGAARHLRRAGGLLALANARMAVCGLSPTEFPVSGDVAVVIDAIGQHVMAIRTGGLWAAKATRGLVIDAFPTLAAWSVEDAEV